MDTEKAAEVVEEDGDSQPHVKKAIVISALAMILAFASLGSSSTTKTLSVGNISLSNMNAVYEFRVLRQLVMSATIDLLNSEESSLASNKNQTASSQSLEKVQKIIAGYEKEVKSLESDDSRDDDKQDIQAKLSQLNDTIRNAKDRNERFEYAEVALQIAIVLVSASIVSTSAFLFWGGFGLGLIGLVMTLNGYLLFL